MWRGACGNVAGTLWSCSGDLVGMCQKSCGGDIVGMLGRGSPRQRSPQQARLAVQPQRVRRVCVCGGGGALCRGSPRQRSPQQAHLAVQPQRRRDRGQLPSSIRHVVQRDEQYRVPIAERLGLRASKSVIDRSEAAPGFRV
eukprot:364324-Chlamydomonas_euryale.AAC.5